jgi:hypothetical protein
MLDQRLLHSGHSPRISSERCSTRPFSRRSRTMRQPGFSQIKKDSMLPAPIWLPHDYRLLTLHSIPVITDVVWLRRTEISTKLSLSNGTSNNAVADGVLHKSCERTDVDLQHDSRSICFNRAHTDLQYACYFFVASSLRQELHQLTFSIAQAASSGFVLSALRIEAGRQIFF